MSLLGKLCLSLSGLSLIILTSTTWILGGWLPVLYIFLILFFLGIFLSLIIDYKLYLGFLLMKTTKNGMSMGVSILITLMFCISLAYLSTRFEKSVDITEEKINSLAPQTIQLLAGLEDKIHFIVFYQGSGGYQKKDLVKKSLFLLKQKSSKVKDRYYDAYLKNKLAQEYLNDIPNKEKQDIFVFTEYKGNKVLVEFPFNEEKLTSAMIKATRREERTIYFLSGHGEREFSNQSGAGISALETALVGSSFKVKTWNFITDGELPENISALIIAGPQRPYLDKEIQWLKQYLKKGGRALIALDPDKNNNLTEFLKSFGVNYKAHYIMDRMSAFVGLGRFSPLGIHFDTQHAVTKSFQQGTPSIFHLASDLEIMDNSDLFSVTSLIRTDVNALSVPNINTDQKQGKRSSHIIALLVEERAESNENSEKKETNVAKKSDKKSPSMMLAVFGDSDFLSNDFINKGINRDIVMNIVSYLVDESDLVSIRPKRLKATQLVLKNSDKMGVILFAIVFPIICFMCSFVIWFRRREA